MNLDSELVALADEGLLRRRRITGSPCGPTMIIDGQPVLAFASNDYLGLATHPRLIEATVEGVRRWGVGAGASHFLGGHSEAHQALEERLAAFVGMDKALLFSTGYMANLGVVPALAGRGDAIFADKLNHASLIDAVRLSLADSHRYGHLDVASLAGQLAASKAKRKLIVTDAVFSMDGDLAPLPELLALAERFDAWLLVDDAHGFGVLGPQGRGAAAHFGLPATRHLLVMGTLGKAAGIAGAFVAGEHTAIDWLEQKARTAVFTTAAPPMLASGLLASLTLIESADPGDLGRAHLQALIGRLRAGLAAICVRQGWRLLPSATAIQPLVIGTSHAATAVAEALLARGIWAPAIRPPTVPTGQARLRISLSAAHSEADVDRLVAALADLPT
jgi:8-amino-7-oxononanoate synthase